MTRQYPEEALSIRETIDVGIGIKDLPKVLGDFTGNLEVTLPGQLLKHFVSEQFKVHVLAKFELVKGIQELSALFPGLGNNIERETWLRRLLPEDECKSLQEAICNGYSTNNLYRAFIVGKTLIQYADFVLEEFMVLFGKRELPPDFPQGRKGELQIFKELCSQRRRGEEEEKFSQQVFAIMKDGMFYFNTIDPTNREFVLRKWKKILIAYANKAYEGRRDGNDLLLAKTQQEVINNLSPGAVYVYAAVMLRKYPLLFEKQQPVLNPHSWIEEVSNAVN